MYLKPRKPIKIVLPEPPKIVRITPYQFSQLKKFSLKLGSPRLLGLPNFVSLAAV